MINHYLKLSKTQIVEISIDYKKNKNIRFSERAIEILKLICEGLSCDDIAERLGLSKRTIEGHKYRICKKTGLKNTPELINFAIQNKLVKK